MKLLLLCCLTLTQFAQAEIFGFVEQYTIVNRGAKTARPQANFWYQQDFREGSKWGVWNWSQTSNYYTLSEGGISYRITKSLQIGGGAGAENIGTHQRFATFAFYAKGKNTVFATVETGASGRWHQALYTRNIGRFEAGAMSQEFLGVGPRGALNLAKGHIKIWGAYFLEKENGRSNQNAIAGVRYVFFKP